MSARDIMPYDSVHGGHTRTMRFPMKASEVFFVGEPVSVDVNGLVTESADNPADTDFAGFAVEGPGASNVNPKTGTTYATNDPIALWVPQFGDTFITKSWSSGGSTFDDVAPLITNVGDECGLSLISNVWGVDINASNKLVRIVDVLDVQKRSIIRTKNTVTIGDTYYMIFSVIASQFQQPTDAAAPDS